MNVAIYTGVAATVAIACRQPESTGRRTFGHRLQEAHERASATLVGLCVLVLPICWRALKFLMVGPINVIRLIGLRSHRRV